MKLTRWMGGAALRLILVGAALPALATGGGMVEPVSGRQASADLRACDLRTEKAVNPLGVENLRPHLGWRLDSRQDGVMQGAYRVLVASSREKLDQDEGDLWDSGRRVSDESEVIYGGKPPVSLQQCHWKVKVWDQDGREGAWSAPAFWMVSDLTPGWIVMAKWDTPGGKTFWIGAPPVLPFLDTRPAPATYLRTEFRIDGEVKRAVLLVTALGLYEFRLNGEKVGDRQLTPEWTDYQKRILYQVYDVTSQVRTGWNAAGAMLTQGWYAGRIGMKAGRGHYGRHLRLKARLHVELADGRTLLMETGPAWKGTIEGPIQSADLFDGEIHDARRQMPGWDQPGFDDSKWFPVAAEINHSGGRLTAQLHEPVRITGRLKPVSVKEVGKGVYLADFGQNIAGWCRLKVRNAREGQVVRLRHGEALAADGSLYVANLRSAPAIDALVSAGGKEEVFEPRFTFHGFRHVEISGLTSAPKEGDLEAMVVGNDLEQTLELETSSPLLNKIWKAVQWSQRGNFLAVPTDCPQRDERLGWLGDIQVFSQTAIYNMNCRMFLEKFTQDIRDGQAVDGRFPDFAPIPHGPDSQFSGNAAWADGGVILPWRLYVNYGDKDVLEENYAAMRRWVEFLRSVAPDHIRREKTFLTPLDYGDWLSPDPLQVPGAAGQEGVDKTLFATAFYAHSVDLMARIAGKLGKDQDRREYEDLQQKIRAAIAREFLNEQGLLRRESQGAYALLLHFDLIPPASRARARARLATMLEQTKMAPLTGIQTTPRLLAQLQQMGRGDLAYGVMMRTEKPSLGYMVTHGATTVWERWDGWTEEKGFADPQMNSLNHYAFGAPGEWMVQVIGGLRPDPEHPGYRHFFIAPEPGGGLTWARCTYRSVRGTISSAWWLEEGTLKLWVEAPAGTRATVGLPARDPELVTCGGVLLGKSGLKWFRHPDNGRIQVAVASGRHEFSVRTGAGKEQNGKKP